MRIFQSNGGGEFISKNLHSHFTKCGIHHQFSYPYTPSQNGRAKRKHRHIIEKGLTMLFHVTVPLHFWVEAFSTSVFIINRLLTLVLNEISSFEILYGKSPLYATFWIFGCLCFPNLRDYAKHKFEPISLPCIFLGYHTSYKGFRCLDPISHRVFVTRHASFDENVFLFSSSSMQPSSAISDFIAFHDPTSLYSVMPSTNSSAGSSSSPSVTSSMSCKSCALELLPSPSSSISVPHVSTPLEEPLPTIPIALASHQNSHPMITRGKVGISKSKQYNYVCQIPSSPLLSSLLVMKEPKGFKSATKFLEWLATMEDEIRALKLNQTWELVPRPPATNMVGSK